MGVEKEQTAHVGDRLDLDAEGAAAAGLHGVWLGSPRNSSQSRPRRENLDAARATYDPAQTQPPVIRRVSPERPRAIVCRVGSKDNRGLASLA
jgi:hypothetical protein